MFFFGAIFRLRATSECYDRYAAVISPLSLARNLNEWLSVLLKLEKSIVGLTHIFFVVSLFFMVQ